MRRLARVLAMLVVAGLEVCLMPPPNTTPATAEVITALPYVAVLDVTDAPTGSSHAPVCESGSERNAVWYAYTPGDNEYTLAVLAKIEGSDLVSATGDYAPAMSVWTGAIGSLAQYLPGTASPPQSMLCGGSLGATKWTHWWQVPVTPGTTYYFQIVNGTTGSGALDHSLRFEVRAHPHETAPVGSLLIPSDKPPWNWSALSSADGGMLRRFPLTGMGLYGSQMLPTGEMCVASVPDSDWSTLQDATVLDAALDEVVTHNFAPARIVAIATDFDQYFYVATQVGSGGSAQAVKVQRIAKDGTLTADLATLHTSSGASADRMFFQVARDGSAAYFLISSSTNQPILAHDLVNNIAMSNLAAGVSGERRSNAPNVGFVGDDGTIFVGYYTSLGGTDGGQNGKIRRYNPAGTLLDTYTLGSTTNLLSAAAFAHDGDASFWIRLKTNTGSSTANEQLRQIQISDGSTLLDYAVTRHGSNELLNGKAAGPDIPLEVVCWGTPLIVTTVELSVDTEPLPPITFDPTRALQGRDIILGAVEVHHPDADGTPRTYDWGGVAITERVLTPGRHYEGRVLSFSDITAALSDRRTGILQRTGCRVLTTDRNDDYSSVVLREWLARTAGRTPRGAELVCKLNSHKGIIDGSEWFIVFRGRLERWGLGAGFQTEIEGLAWPFQRLQQAALTKTIGNIITTAPTATRDRIAQLVLGRQSDEPSVTAAPVFVDDEAGRGGQGGADPLGSYGDIGLAAPTGLVIALNPGAGNAILGSHPNDEYYVFAAHVYQPSPGVFVVGDPEPFLPEDESVIITANNDAIDAWCDASADPDYYATRFYLGTRVVGAPQLAIQAHHYIQTNDPVTGVTFDGLAPSTSSTGSVEAVNPAANLKRIARMDDGRTAPSVRAHLVSVGYPRPMRMASDPIVGVIEYEDYVEYATGVYEWRFDFSPLQVNSNGDPYNIFNWSSSGATIVPGGIPTPQGKVSPIYGGAQFIDNNGVDGWGMALVSARPCADFFSAYFNGVVIPSNHYVNGEIRAPFMGNWDVDFGPAKYLEVDGHKLFPVMLRGYMLEAFLHSLGLAELTEDAEIEGTDGVATLDASTAAEIVVTEVRNNWTDVVVAAAGANTAPTISVSGGTITVTLGTDGTQNTAGNIAALFAGVPNIRSAVATDGSGTVTTQTVNFDGGTPDFTFQGNDWRGPFKVNIDGLGKNLAGDIGEGGGDETVITDPVELVGIIADNGVLDDATISEQNRLVSSRSLLTAPLTFADGTARRDEDNFAQAALDLGDLITQGNTFGFVITDGITHENLLASMFKSGPLQGTFGLNGQFRVTVPNPNAAPSAHIEARREVIHDSFSADATIDGYANALQFRWSPTYDVDGSFEYANESIAEDATSQSRNDERVVDELALEMPWRESEHAATRVAELLVAEQAYLPLTVRVDGGIHWVHRNPGDPISVTHSEGYGLAGWTEHMLRITGIRVEVDLIRTSLTCVDLRRDASDPT